MSYKRNKETQRRLKKVAEGPGRRYSVGVYYDEDNKCYQRYFLGKADIKRLNHKITRRKLKKTDANPKEAGHYKKYDNYWDRII